MSSEEVKRNSISSFLLRTAERWPDKPAVTFSGVTRTWLETKERCHAAATLFRRLGVGQGDRIAYLGLNSNVCFETYYSPALIGAVFVPINHRLSIGEMKECLDDCAPKLLIVDENFGEHGKRLAKSCESLQETIYSGQMLRSGEGLSYEDSVKAIISSEEYCELSPSSEDEVVIFFYTGGTTGRSKGVMLTNNNLVCNTNCTIPLYRMKQHWAFVIVGPLFHVAAGSRVFSCAVLAGHAVILSKFDVTALLGVIEKYKINSATLVPTMYQLILDHPEFCSFDLSSLKMLASGAAPLSDALLRRILEVFPTTEFFQTYGMTEASPVLTSLDSKYHVLTGPNSKKLGSVGRSVEHVDLIIADDQDREVPPNTIGQILAKGPNIMKGYWKLTDATQEALEGGWYHTGDAGYLDEEGFLYLEGRVKDMIVSGGENIYPIEVENVLENHPAIHQCAVIGIPHDTWGEAVHAVVTLNKGDKATEEELINFCKSAIASYKCPVSVTFRLDPMPLSPINKILKTELRKPFWEGRGSKLV